MTNCAPVPVPEPHQDPPPRGSWQSMVLGEISPLSLAGIIAGAAVIWLQVHQLETDVDKLSLAGQSNTHQLIGMRSDLINLKENNRENFIA